MLFVMPTKAELEAELAAVKSRMEAQQSQQSLLLRAFGNTTSLFDETPVKELVPLLRAAHDARANAAAEAIAKAICSTNGRAGEMGGAWALTLRYLPDGVLTSCCIKQVVQYWSHWSQLATLKGELDFPTMYRLLTKLPQDRQTASVTQTTEFMVDNLNNLPAHGPWQRLEDIEWRIVVERNAVDGDRLALGQQVRFHGSCEGVVTDRSAYTLSAYAPATWGATVSNSYIFSKHAFSRGRSIVPKVLVQTNNAYKFEGSLQLAKSAPRAELLEMLGRHDAASEDALDVLQWAAASLRGMEGCDEAKAKECEDVLLQRVSGNFSESSAALATLPASLLGRLLRCDEVNTQTEEQTLLALAPWLEAPARTAEEVAEALQGLRWAWLPARLVGRLLDEGGALAKFGEAEPAKDLVEKALSSKSAFKRARDDSSELNCPITHDLFEDPVLAADGHTYERAAIQQLITRGNLRSPMTNERLAHSNLTANRTVKKLVGAHRAMLEAAGSRKRLRFETSEPPTDRLSDSVS